MARVTMSEIASAAQVSRSTVSRVLSDQAAKYRISESTAERVKKVAADLGYRPNSIARSLRTRSTKTLGLLVSDISNPFFGNIAWAIERAAEVEGFTLIVCNSAEEQPREKSYIEELRSRQIDGLIISPVQEEHEHFRALQEEGFPFVLLDRYFEDLACDCVVCDNVEGARHLTNAVKELGHERIGFIGGRPAATTNQDRFLGYWQAVSGEDGDQGDRALVRERDFTREAGRWGMTELLGLDSPPTAVVAANNYLMTGALEVLMEHEKSGADPVLVAGFDVVPFLQFLGRPILCVSQPEVRLGEEAARIVIDRIRGEAGPPRQVVLKQEVLSFNLSDGKDNR